MDPAASVLETSAELKMPNPIRGVVPAPVRAHAARRAGTRIVTTEQVVLLVAGVIGLVIVVNLAIWIPVRRRLRAQPAQLSAELAAAGEHLVLGPEAGIYRGGTATGYPRTGGNGTIALTDRRVAFRRALGGPIDIPISQIGPVRKDRWFRSGARMGQLHVIVGLRSGGEVGFYVRDADSWLAALEQVAASA
jgi:hypothetical protein